MQMKRITIFCLVYFTAVHCEFATVLDPDGFVYVRSLGNKTKTVIDSLKNEQIVYCFEGEEGGWRSVEYDDNGKVITGYIHGSRLIPVSRHRAIKPNKISEASIKFKTNDMSLKITNIPFDSTINKYDSEKVNNNELEKINGKDFWGTDGGLPKFQYGAMVLRVGNRNIRLPIDDLFEPNLDQVKLYVIDKADVIFITADNGDGAGAYSVLWKIEKGEFKKRVVAIPF